MKTGTSLILILIPLLVSADPFRNLGFDDAVTNNMTPANPYFGEAYGTSTDLLPGWAIFVGNRQINVMGYNLFLAGYHWAGIFNERNPYGLPVQGRYALIAAPSPSFSETEPYQPITLVQHGDVPPEAQSLHFVARSVPLEVRMNDSLIPLVYVRMNLYSEQESDFYSVAGDISAFAGQNVELKLMTLEGTYDHSILDDLRFSPEAIPEPAVGFLLALAGLAWGLGGAQRRGS